MSDTYSLTFLAVILVAVGSVMCGKKTAVQKWSARFAGAAWLGYSVFYGGPEAEDWVMACLGGFLAAGLVYGIALIALSVLSLLFGGTVKTYHVEKPPQDIQLEPAYQMETEPVPQLSQEEQAQTARIEYERRLEILKDMLPPEHFEIAKRQLYKAFLEQIEAIVQ